MKKLLLILLFSSMGIFAQQASWDWAHYSGGKTVTTSTSGDSLSFGSSGAWIKFTIAADDTIYFSLDGTYPAANKMVLLPGESYTSGKIDFAYFQKLYFKTDGVGTPVCRVFWEGQ